MMLGRINLLRHLLQAPGMLAVVLIVNGVVSAQAPPPPVKIDPAALQQVGANPEEGLSLILKRYRERLAKRGFTKEQQDELLNNMQIAEGFAAVQQDMKVIFSRNIEARRGLVGAVGVNAAGVQDQIRQEAFDEAVQKNSGGTIVPADLLENEQKRGSPEVVPQVGANIVPPADLQQPFDWRTSGAVPSQIRNQGTCNSCWAFTAAGVAECSLMMQSPQGTFNNGQPDFSEDYILAEMGKRCQDFGHYTTAWTQVLTSANGIPDQGVQSSTLPHRHRVGAWGLVSETAWIPSDNEIKTALRQHGPLAACLKIEDILYTKGTMGPLVGEENANVPKVDHAVIIVGWTNQGWIIRNSWGPDYGVDGYQTIAFGTMGIGYSAAWATYGTNGTVVPRTPAVVAKPTGLLNQKDRISMEIWRNLALLQADRDQSFDNSLFNLRPDSLRAETGTVKRATDADRPFLRTKVEVEKEWSTLLP